MAKGRKTGGRDIQPGQVLNPRGQGAVSPRTRALRAITMEHIEEVADVILEANLQGLHELHDDPETSVLKVWLASAAINGIENGDIGPLEIILNRTMGKPKERHEITGKDGGPLGEVSDAEVEARYQELMRKAEAARGSN